MRLRNLILKYDPLFESRNIVITIVLYGVFVSAASFSLISTFDIINRFVEYAGTPFRYWLFDGTDDTFIAWVSYNYGKGWIPGWLIGIIVGICNYRIIRGNRDGLYWMLVSFCLICLPTIFIELEEYLCFSVSIMAAFVVYFAFLFLRRERKCYWGVCKCAPIWLRITVVVASIVWFFMVISSYHYFELYNNFT